MCLLFIHMANAHYNVNKLSKICIVSNFYMFTTFYCRRLWVQPRVQNWWDMYKDCNDDKLWRSHFRMNLDTFNFILRIVGPCVIRQRTRFREVCCYKLKNYSLPMTYITINWHRVLHPYLKK